MTVAAPASLAGRPGPGRGPVARRARWWLPRLALAVLVGLALGTAIDVVRAGGPRLWLARHGVQPAYEALGRRVSVGGRSLYLDCRGAGGPTIVLEAGMGSGAEGWGAVLPELAELSRTCAYDRLGRGRSDAGGRTDLAAAADDLTVLLSAAGERGPYLLVGHSLGADIARVFAGRHRDEVAGLLLLDGFDPDILQDRVLPLVGPLAPEYRAGLAALWAQVGRVEGYQAAPSEAQLRAADLRGLPVEVLLAPRTEPRLDPADNAAIVEARRAGYEALSPGRVRVSWAEGSGHLVALDRPDLVVAAVRRLLGREPGTTGLQG